MAENDIAGSGLPSTAAEARRLGSKRYFTGEPCRNGHVAERLTSNMGCWTCAQAKKAKIPRSGLACEAVAGDLPRSMREARAAGVPHYRTGRPCKNGHVDRRFTRTGNCVPCAVQRAAETMRNLTPKKAAEYAETRRRWIRKNPDKVREGNRRAYERNPEDKRRRSREYAAKNPDKIKARVLRSADRIRERTRNRRALIRGVEGRFTEAEFHRILARQRYRCGYCRGDLRKSGYQRDHVVSLKRGGDNRISNIQALCPLCNQRKNARDPIEFAQSMGFLL